MIKRKSLTVPKNPRKCNIWDSAFYNELLNNTVQITHNIDKVSKETNIPISSMKPLLLPAHLVYEICEGYTQMYNKLLKEQLLVTANLKSNPIIH